MATSAISAKPVGGVPAIQSPVIDNKSKKYDRQLRLWGDHGQQALESSKVCLINASATGTEILKNLILPGVGSFTIIDGQMVTGEDVGNNFFLTKSSIGQSRASATTKLLKELNEDDVAGDYIEETVDNLLDNGYTFFNKFHIVIAADLPERSLQRLAAVLWDIDVPFLICRSYGFIGYIRIVLKEHTVIESHPDESLQDLRLDRPFQGLVEYCNPLDLGTMSKRDHSHTPWVVIVYKYLETWKAQHGGLAPRTFDEKKQLKAMIKAGILRNAEGIPREEENFEEAMRAINTVINPTQIPGEILSIFNDDCCTNLHSESKPFWLLARAVKEFVQNEGQGLLPLRGTIPDMTADSDRYVNLQETYRQQAANDVTAVSNHLQNILQSLGRDEPLTIQKCTPSPTASPAGKPQDQISDEDIKTFCKNASFLQVIRCRSLASEYDPNTANTDLIAEHVDEYEADDVVWYVLLRAVDRFYSERNKFPGYYTDNIEVDIAELKSYVQRLLQEWGIATTIRDDYVHEICRYGAAELPSIAAYIGGVAAQEVIKVVTAQFVPFNNTFIYNAIKQTSITVEL